MTTDNAQRSVLLIGKSQLVLDESVAGLRDLGYKALATNDFTNISGRFDVKEGRTLDLLHGKQDLWFPFGVDIPCKCAGSQVVVVLRFPRLSPRVHGGLGTH